MWKYFSVFCALFLLSLPVFSESETEFQVPSLEPEATYEMKGQDIMTLYQTINDLNETKTEYQNLMNETLQTSKDALTFAQEYKSENQKLQIQNNFLIGGITLSVGVIVVGGIVLVCSNMIK